MEIKCNFCAKKFSGVIELSKHLKEHKISQKKYFEQFYPRHDLLNKNKIHFKSVEQYFLSDFEDKISMKSWLNKIGHEKALDYISGKIKKYCEVKNLKNAPPEFFIQTISCLPSIRIIEKLCGADYNTICAKSTKESK